jgi:hypothetical protein
MKREKRLNPDLHTDRYQDHTSGCQAGIPQGAASPEKDSGYDWRGGVCHSFNQDLDLCTQPAAIAVPAPRLKEEPVRISRIHDRLQKRFQIALEARQRGHRYCHYRKE